MDVLEKADFPKAQKAAEKILQDFEYTSAPINPVTIANAMGVAVRFATFAEDINDRVSGFFDFEENTIYVNETESPYRQTFTIAHELGHKVLHEDYIKSSEYTVLLRQTEMTGNKSPIEQEADAFAANLLVPRFLLDKYRNLATPEKLSHLFVVSESVIRNRLKFYRD